MNTNSSTFKNGLYINSPQITKLNIASSLDSLIASLESNNSPALDSRLEQNLYILSLDTWREVTKRKDINVTKAKQIIQELNGLKTKTLKPSTHRAIDMIV